MAGLVDFHRRLHRLNLDFGTRIPSVAHNRPDAVLPVSRGLSGFLLPALGIAARNQCASHAAVVGQAPRL